MVATQFLLASFVAAASATALGSEEAIFAKLLKRQEPGTPAYNCHDNCGTAITISKQGNPCDSDAFQTNYENCLICSGPDNYNIWRYYGRSLSTAGTTCGLDTEPKSGKQPDVGPAVHPPESSSAPPAESTPAPTEEPTTTPNSPTSAGPVTTPATEASSEESTTTEPTSAGPTSEEPTSSGPTSAESTSTEATSGSPTTVSSLPTLNYTPGSSGVVPTPILSSTGTGAPLPSTNGTASFTASPPPEQSVNAAANLGAVDAAGVFGAIFVGALLGM